MAPTVSVVIPTFGRSRFVVEAVRAALGQSRSPDEVVVSDDCSPDDTVERLDEVAMTEPRLRVVRQPKNLGGVDNWSAVIDASRGDYIAYCSDDDQFAPGHLERAVQFLETNPGIAMVHGAFDTLESLPDGTSRVVSHSLVARSLIADGVDAAQYIRKFYSWPFHPSTLVFRRSLWTAAGRFNRRFQLADTEWFLRCSLYGKIAFLPEVHVINRRHRDNWSNRVGAVEMHREVAEIVEGFLDELERCGQERDRVARLRRAWRRFHAYRCARLALARARAGAREQAVGALLLAVEVTPLLRRLPRRVVEQVGGFMAGAVGLAQRVLPGRSRYESLGVSVPK